MNYDAVKERLHGYIEHTTHEMVLAIYTLVSNDLETGVKYDEATQATLDSLEETMNNMLSGKKKHMHYSKLWIISANTAVIMEYELILSVRSEKETIEAIGYYDQINPDP